MGLLLGIDLGTSAVKSAILQKAGDTYKLKDIGLEPVHRPEFEADDPNGVSTATGMESEAALRALQRTVSDHKLQRKLCAASTAGPRVAARLFRFPKIDKKSIAGAVREQAEKDIPFDITGAALHFVLFDDIIDEDGVVKNEGLVVATHQKEIDYITETLEAAKLTPIVQDIDALAVANCWVGLRGVREGEVIAILNIGARLTNLTILHGNERVFVRDIPMAGDMVSRAVGQYLGVDLPTAESRKLDMLEHPLDAVSEAEKADDMIGMTGNLGKFAAQQGYDYLSEGGHESMLEAEEPVAMLQPEKTDEVKELAPEPDMHATAAMDYRPGSDSASAPEAKIIRPAGSMDPESALYKVMDDALRELVHEVQDTIKYYVSKRIVPKVDRMIVTGGSSLIPQLPEFLSEALGQTCEFWNPLLDVDVSPVTAKVPHEVLEEVGPAMAVALGLAMRSS